MESGSGDDEGSSSSSSASNDSSSSNAAQQRRPIEAPKHVDRQEAATQVQEVQESGASLKDDKKDKKSSKRKGDKKNKEKQKGESKNSSSRKSSRRKEHSKKKQPKQDVDKTQNETLNEDLPPEQSTQDPTSSRPKSSKSKKKGKSKASKKDKKKSHKSHSKQESNHHSNRDLHDSTITNQSSIDGLEPHALECFHNTPTMAEAAAAAAAAAASEATHVDHNLEASQNIQEYGTEMLDATSIHLIRDDHSNPHHQVTNNDHHEHSRTMDATSIHLIHDTEIPSQNNLSNHHHHHHDDATSSSLGTSSMLLQDSGYIDTTSTCFENSRAKFEVSLTDMHGHSNHNKTKHFRTSRDRFAQSRSKFESKSAKSLNASSSSFGGSDPDAKNRFNTSLSHFENFGETKTAMPEITKPAMQWQKKHLTTAESQAMAMELCEGSSRDNSSDNSITFETHTDKNQGVTGEEAAGHEDAALPAKPIDSSHPQSEPTVSMNRDTVSPPAGMVKKLGLYFAGGASKRRDADGRLCAPRIVLQKRLKVLQGYKAPVFTKTVEQQQQLAHALSKTVAFAGISKEKLRSLVAAFEPQQVETGMKINHGKADRDAFYIVTEGEVSVGVDGEQVGSVKAGETFGEHNLFQSMPVHTQDGLSLVASKKAQLFKVSQTTYRSILQLHTVALDQTKCELLDKLPSLKKASKADKQKIASVMKVAEFAKGDEIPINTPLGSRFFLVSKGNVRCRNSSRPDDPERLVSPGEIFSADTFSKRRRVVEYETEAIAETDVTVFYIDKSTFDKVIGPAEEMLSALPAIDHKEIAKTAAAVDELRFNKKKPLTIVQREAVSGLFKEVIFEKGDIILEANKESPACMYFLKLGVVEAKDTSSTNSVSYVMPGSFFAKEFFSWAVWGSAKTARSTVRLVAVETCVAGVVTIDDYLETREVYIQKANHRAARPCDSSNSDDFDESSSFDSDADSVALDKKGRHFNFETLAKKVLLGEGGYGQVWLVVDKSESKPQGYALKIQSKYELTTAGDAQVAVDEKNTMASLDHPNVIKLLGSYQDTHFLYMLLELVQGGELYSRLLPSDESSPVATGLGEEQAKFYALGIADALAHIHGRGYVYRDLKPENVLINSHGYPIIVDFGLAKHLPDGEKTFTLKGTPDYLAPECILSTGHTFSADHWSLGVLTYELICGISPFFFPGIDNVELYRSITQDPHRPLESASTNAIALVDGLLTKEPYLRLGSLKGGEQDILNHKWFAGMDLVAMRRRKIRAPWKPDIIDSLDTSSFETWDNVEDKTNESYPMVSPQEAIVFESF